MFSPVTIVTKISSEKIKDLNATARTLFGVTSIEVVGKPIRTLIPNLPSNISQYNGKEIENLFIDLNGENRIYADIKISLFTESDEEKILITLHPKKVMKKALVSASSQENLLSDLQDHARSHKIKFPSVSRRRNLSASQPNTFRNYPDFTPICNSPDRRVSDSVAESLDPSPMGFLSFIDEEDEEDDESLPVGFLSLIDRTNEEDEKLYNKLVLGKDKTPIPKNKKKK